MINPNEQQYLNLLQELVDKAERTPLRQDRTQVGTYSVFGRTLEFDLTHNKVPLLTTKKVNYTKALEELFWMYRLGNPDMSYMDAVGNGIWRQWAQYDDEHPKGSIGRLYGAVIRDPECDQITYVLDLLRETPTSRRAVFSAFDPKAVALESLSFKENLQQGRGVLNCCHSNFNQLYINENNQLEMYTYTRSNDYMVGNPFNVFNASVLAHLFARDLGIEASRLIYQIGDVHLYSNHLDGAKEQLSRIPFECPTITISEDIKIFDDWNDVNQIQINNYNHHGFIKLEVAI